MLIKRWQRLASNKQGEQKMSKPIRLYSCNILPQLQNKICFNEQYLKCSSEVKAQRGCAPFIPVREAELIDMEKRMRALEKIYKCAIKVIHHARFLEKEKHIAITEMDELEKALCEYEIKCLEA